MTKAFRILPFNNTMIFYFPEDKKLTLQSNTCLNTIMTPDLRQHACIPPNATGNHVYPFKDLKRRIRTHGISFLHGQVFNHL